MSTADTTPTFTAPTAPPSPLAGALRMVDYWATVYLRTWKGSVITSFVTPLLYIVAMGVLLGGFIEVDPRSSRAPPPTWRSWRRGCSRPRP